MEDLFGCLFSDTCAKKKGRGGALIGRKKHNFKITVLNWISDFLMNTLSPKGNKLRVATVEGWTRSCAVRDPPRGLICDVRGLKIQS